MIPIALLVKESIGIFEATALGISNSLLRLLSESFEILLQKISDWEICPLIFGPDGLTF